MEGSLGTAVRAKKGGAGGCFGLACRGGNVVDGVVAMRTVFARVQYCQSRCAAAVRMGLVMPGEKAEQQFATRKADDALSAATRDWVPR